MEKKPITGLVLFSPLELIPMESLPTRRGEELALLKEKRQGALGEVFGSCLLTLIAGIFAGLSVWTSFLTWFGLGHAPLVLSLFMTLTCVGLLVCFAFALREFASNAREYWQTVIPSHLEADAKAETALSEAAKCLNWQIAQWNLDAAEAAQQNVDEELCSELRKHRGLLAEHGEYIKRLSKHLNRKR